jgi:hypothetical protein
VFSSNFTRYFVSVSLFTTEIRFILMSIIDRGRLMGHMRRYAAFIAFNNMTFGTTLGAAENVIDQVPLKMLSKVTFLFLHTVLSRQLANPFIMYHYIYNG